MPFVARRVGAAARGDAADAVRGGPERLRGLNEPISLEEVVEIYLPLSRLLNLHVAATQELHAATATFLGTTETAAAVRHRRRRQRRSGEEHDRAPAAGAALALAGPSARRSGHHRRLPAAERRARGARSDAAQGISRRATTCAASCSSWPTSRAGAGSAARRSTRTSATTSSPGEWHVVTQPDIVIVEGLNVLQSGTPRPREVRSGLRVGLLRLLDLRRRRRARHRELVRRAVHDAARDGVPDPRRTSIHYAR